MVSKKEKIAQLEAKLNAAQADAERLSWLHESAKRSVERYKLSEDARASRERAERERKRQEAEREDRRKRRQELSDGMLRIADAHSWSFDHEVGEVPVLHLSVTLDADTYPVVRGVIDKLNAPPVTTGAAFGARYDVDEWQRRVMDSITAMSANTQRIRLAHGI